MLHLNHKNRENENSLAFFFSTRRVVLFKKDFIFP